MAHIVRRTFHTFRHLAKLKNISDGVPKEMMNPSDLPVDFLPPINRTMEQLDRSFFKKTIPLSAATIFDVKNISTIRSELASSREIWSTNPIKPLRPDPENPEKKCILLSPQVRAADRETWSPTLQKLEDEGKVKVRTYDLNLTYDDWGMRMILDAVLPEFPPEETETPAGFSAVGHVAHVNLRDQYLPWKHLIGQVLLDKNKATISTVINKVEDVGAGAENDFRTFPYEVLAGPDNVDVTVHESDCEFQFNFGKVYWNTRLQTEHKRVIDKFQPGEAVCDVMAGVGPYAVPAGKRKVFAWANDLNPNSVAALYRAIKKNKVERYVNSYCLDGRKFIRWATDMLLTQQRGVTETVKKKGQRPVHIKYTEPRTFDHYVMNLPKTAVEFLDAFRGIYANKEFLFESGTANEPAPRKLPLIHVYLFTDRRGPGTLQTEEEETEVCRVVSEHLGHEITRTTPDVELLYARLVSPNRKYYRATFRLPPEVAFAQPRPLNITYVVTGKDVLVSEDDDERYLASRIVTRQ